MNSSGDIGLLPSGTGGGMSSPQAFAVSASSPVLNSKMVYSPNPSNTGSVTSIGGMASSVNSNVNSVVANLTSGIVNDSLIKYEEDLFNVKWTKVNEMSIQSIQPRPRHGHRAVAYGNMMIIFGGGNEGIVDEIHVFDVVKQEWFSPQVKGDIPTGCAAYGMVLDGCRVLIYGGMIEYGRYSSDLYELQIPKWEWKKLKPKGPRSGEPPCARLGHSFTLIRDQVFLFGGLANDSDDLKLNIPRYLNDVYALQVRLNNEHGIWDIPVTFGSPPGPRESHSAVAYKTKDNKFNRLIVYGGMSGCRLGDLYMLDVDTLMWNKPEVKGATPSPRSLHTAILVGEKMYVFGGWVPMLVEELKTSEKEWKCTNSLACLNLESLNWENIHQDILDDKVPRARAGHSAVVINTRIYIWSGRDGYRKAWNNQVCCKDLWQLEVQRPGDPGKVQLLRAGTNWLEIGWNPLAGADSYTLQVVAYDASDQVFPHPEAGPTPQSPQQAIGVGASNSSSYAPAASPIMTPVPISKPAKSLVPKEQIPISIPTPLQTPQSMVTMTPQSVSMLPQGSFSSPVAVSSSLGISQQQTVQLPIQISASQPEIPASSSVITLSMPSLAPTTMPMSADQQTLTMVSSAASVSPAVLPTASSLYTLPANVAGTASSLLASKSVTRPSITPVTSTPQSPLGRGVLRHRAPVQVSSPRTPGTVVTNIPPGTVLKTTPTGQVLATSSQESASAQMSGMNALAAAAAATQKIQTPPTVKLVQQQPGQSQVFSQVKVANVSGVLPSGIRLGSPVTAGGKPSDVKQIIVQKPGAPGGGNQIYTVVKTSQGMALANLQGSKVIQGKPGGVTTTSVVPASSMQASPQKPANIIKWVAAPGTSLPSSVSKPNIIATNQPQIISLAGQGASGNSPRPAYIISKPSTTVASRPQQPQYVVVTQASAIRSIQGMAANSLASGQTITLPTSVAGGSTQGVKMIVMPSGNGPPTAGQSVKIITPGGMQTTNAPKTVTLAQKPTQYLTTTGQIVTIPQGLLQASQQQINIGGKQVTLQMAGGQKLAILSNPSGQIIQSTQSPSDVGKPKFVMVGPGQKAPISAASTMRVVGNTLQTTEASSSSIGDAVDGLVEMAGGGGIPSADAQFVSVSDQQNGMSDDSGLKGGSCLYGPSTTFNFEGLPWMKLKGGTLDNEFAHLLHNRDSTIPIYSASSKFSWATAFNFGLKGGSKEEEEQTAVTQESLNATETQTAAAEGQAASETVTEAATGEHQEKVDSSTSGNQETLPEAALSATLSDNAETSSLIADATSSPSALSENPTGNNAEPETTAPTNTEVEMQDATPVSNEATLADASASGTPETSSVVAPTVEGFQIPVSIGDGIPMDTSDTASTTFEIQLAPANATEATNGGSMILIPQTTASQLPMGNIQPPQTVSVQFVSQSPNPQSIVSQQSITLDTPAPVITTLPVTHPQHQQTAFQIMKHEQQRSSPSNIVNAAAVTTVPVVTATIPLTELSATSSNVTTAKINSGASSQSPVTIMQPSPVVLQSSSPIISSIPSVTGSSSPLILSTPVSAPMSLPLGQQIVARIPGPSAAQTMMRDQVPSSADIKPVIPPPIDVKPLVIPPHAMVPTQSVATNGIANQQRLPAPPPEENWMDVCHTKNTTCVVRCYFTTNEKLSKMDPDIDVGKDLEFIKKKVELRPATAYKFRVAAINSCGRGPWGEVTAFKTCLPGFPGAPSSIKISKSVDGATIAWEPPLNTPGDILEYSVYLAVKPPTNVPEPKPGVSNMSFVRVYCGPSNQCNVPTASLSQALVDTTSKPAIIFRIAAKNDKGYGPATQVRWLQGINESSVPNFASNKSGALKRGQSFTPSVMAKRGRPE